MNAALLAGALPLGVLHDIAGGAPGAIHGAAVVLFVTGVLARLPEPFLWRLHHRHLFAPALAGIGLHPERVIYAEAGDGKGRAAGAGERPSPRRPTDTARQSAIDSPG